MSSDKTKLAYSNGEETHSSKITRFWENCKWTTSLVNREKNNLPAEDSKFRNIFPSGWLKKLLKKQIFCQTRNRNAGTKNSSRSNPKNSLEKCEKSNCEFLECRSEPREYSDHELHASCVPFLNLLNGKPFTKAEKASMASENYVSPGAQDPRCSFQSIPSASPVLTNSKPPHRSPIFSYSKSCLAPVENDCRNLNSCGSSSPAKCTHQRSLLPEPLRRGSYSRTQGPLSTDQIMTTKRSARERLLHRNCPFKTNEQPDKFYQTHGFCGLDSVTSDWHTPSQLFMEYLHSHTNCCPFSQKKPNVHCICLVDCLNSNGHICSSHSTCCCRSRSYLPGSGNLNKTYSTYATGRDRQTLSRSGLNRHCDTHVSNASFYQEHREPLKRSSRIVLPSDEENFSRRNVGTSTADLPDTGRIPQNEELSFEKVRDTRVGTGFELASNSSRQSFLRNTSKNLKETFEIDWNVTSHDLVTGQVFHPVKTGNISEFSKFREVDKRRSGSFPSTNRSWKPVSDKKNPKWMSAKDYGDSVARRINPLESRNPAELDLRFLHSTRTESQVGNLTLVSQGKSQSSQGKSSFSESLDAQQNFQESVSKNSRLRIISDANSSISRQQLDENCRRTSIEAQDDLQSIDGSVDRRLKADATYNSNADIKMVKMEDLANYGESEPKADDSREMDRFRTFQLSDKPKPKLGALEKLVRYFSSTPKKVDSEMPHTRKKHKRCFSKYLLNKPEETANFRDATDFPGFTVGTKNKTFTLTSGSANAPVSNLQFPANLAPYRSSESFSPTFLGKPEVFPDTGSVKNPSQNASLILKSQLTTDSDFLSSNNIVPLITMNLPGSSKKSATHLSLNSINAGKLSSGVLKNSKQVSNETLKLRRSSSARFSIRGDFKISEQEEITDFSNSDNEVFEPLLTPCKYSGVPVYRLDPFLSSPML